MTTPPEVVILGGGFAGLNAAKALSGMPVNVTLLDRRNHHAFQPLLYQVATGALNPSDIAVPIRRVFRRQKNVHVLLGEAIGIDTRRKVVELRDGQIAFDFLVVATGATHSYFGHEAWSARAPGLKTIEDAVEIRRRLFLAFEAAERTADEAERNAWMTFAIIGAGPTGVELAGALSEIARHTLAHDFRRIDSRTARVILLEGSEHVLPPYTNELREAARQQLIELDVEVRTSAKVTDIDEEGVRIGSEQIRAKTVLWAAGVKASPLAATLGAPIDHTGRMLVNADLTVPGSESIFVVGDLAAFRHEGVTVPGVAPAAMQMGRHAAKNIQRTMLGLPMLPFHYVDKGSLATIGRAAAVGDIRGLRLTGFVAWTAWLVIHIFFLIGFRNRLFVILQWAWSYVTFERGARLITGETPSLVSPRSLSLAQEPLSEESASKGQAKNEEAKR